MLSLVHQGFVFGFRLTSGVDFSSALCIAFKSTLGLKEESSRSLLFSCEGDAGGAIALLSSLSLRSEPERGAYYFEAFVKGLNLLLDYL
ncbi:hypothetical protein BM1_04000 [Bipolaris maydis]|nr:hypothetical protein BM1_04000 [Bipolaris maydis]